MDCAAAAPLLQQRENTQQLHRQTLYKNNINFDIATDSLPRQNYKTDATDIITLFRPHYDSIANALQKKINGAPRINDYYCEQCKQRGTGKQCETYTLANDFIIIQYA